MKKNQKREIELRLALRWGGTSLNHFKAMEHIFNLTPYKIEEQANRYIRSYRKRERGCDYLLSFAKWIAKNKFSKNRVINDNIARYLERKESLLM